MISLSVVLNLASDPSDYDFVLVDCLLTFSQTHTHNRFTAGLEYVRVHPGQQVPER